MKLKPNASLDFVNTSVAGMRDGVGPLLAVFLIQHAALSPSALSWVLAAPGLASLCLQVPVGFLYDKVADRRRLLALGGICMIFAAYLISRTPGFFGLFGAQALTGFAMSLLSVGIPALSLQLLGAKGFGPRLARNEVFSKIGNFAALGATGLIAQRLGLHWMFFVVYAFAALVILASTFVPSPKAERLANAAPMPEAIELNPTPAAPGAPSALRQALSSGPFLRLISLTCLFFFGNSAMLFIFEQRFVPLHPNGGAGYISSALAVTQVVIFFGSIFLARKRHLGDPSRILCLGFGLMLIRALIFAADGSLIALGAGQVLDGLIAAIVIIVPVRAVAALDEKNFNVLSGTLGTCCSLGASASTITAGYLIQSIGHTATFLSFGAVAAVGLITSALFSLHFKIQQRGPAGLPNLAPLSVVAANSRGGPTKAVS